MSKVSLQNYIRDVQRDMKSSERKALTRAAAFMRGKIRDKIHEVGIKKHTGNLLKGIASVVGEHDALVGFGPPAQHAHLLEFGTKSRTTKKGKVTGHIRPTPIVGPAFEENGEAVMDIITDRFLA